MKKSTIQKVRSLYGVDEYRLSNGLRVLYKQQKAVPVVAVCVTFHVGSRNEAAGHTGATHILEHLLFKDSKKFNRKNGKAITDYLEWLGALMNATTWMDRTNYFELLPKERVGETLEMEADRMRGSLFSDADLASEMTVVRNEYERSRNNPFELLDEEMLSVAYTTHPYRIPTIGLKEDIEGSTAKKLREFYDQYYWPNNATLSVFGDVSWKEVETYVLKYFAPIPASPHTIPELTVVEPPQKEARSITLKVAAGVSIVELMYKVPNATHPDFPAVMLLSTILAGGFASRLQKKLTDTGLVAEVNANVLPLHDNPSVCHIVAALSEKATPEKVIEIMRRELKAIAKTGVTKEELARAKERNLSYLAHEKDGVFMDIRTVSEAIAAGDWTLGYRMEGMIQKVTAADIRRIAKEYFSPKQETSGILINTL